MLTESSSCLFKDVDILIILMLQLWLYRHWKYQYFSASSSSWLSVCVRVCVRAEQAGGLTEGELISVWYKSLLCSSSLSAFVFVSLNISSFFVGPPRPFFLSFLSLSCLLFHLECFFLSFSHCISVSSLSSVVSLCLFSGPYLHLESTTPPLSIGVWGPARIIMLQKACGGNPCGKRKGKQKGDY